MKITVWSRENGNKDSWEPHEFEEEEPAVAYMQRCARPFRLTTELQLRIGKLWDLDKGEAR